MAVQSIRTPIQVGDVAGDQFLVAAGEKPLGEVNRVREVFDLTKKIGPRAEAFEYAWNLCVS